MTVGTDYLGQNRNKSTARAVGLGLDLMSQVIGCILISLLIGYFLDKWLDTTPIFLIVFLVLGIMAAFRNAYLLTKKL